MASQPLYPPDHPYWRTVFAFPRPPLVPRSKTASTSSLPSLPTHVQRPLSGDQNRTARMDVDEAMPRPATNNTPPDAAVAQQQPRPRGRDHGLKGPPTSTRSVGADKNFREAAQAVQAITKPSATADDRRLPIELEEKKQPAAEQRVPTATARSAGVLKAVQTATASSATGKDRRVHLEVEEKKQSGANRVPAPGLPQTGGMKQTVLAPGTDIHKVGVKLSTVGNDRRIPMELEEKKQPEAKRMPDLPIRRPQTDEKQQQTVLAPRTDNHTVGVKLITVLRGDEIADLKRYHDNSLAATTRKAYISDYASFVRWLAVRFPAMHETEIQTQCTLEHVLAYINQLCNDGKKISTINRRLSTIKKHILPRLFSKVIAPGGREEQILREMEAIVKGIRRTIGAEQRVRGKRPLLIESITAMCDIAALVTNEEGKPMPNTQCRDVCLLLFLFFSAMRRNEVVRLLWTDLTFDKRGVVVLIRQSKTDKEAKGQTIGISRLDGAEKAAYCPVKALEAWQELSKGAGESPVFRWISKKDEIQWRILIDQRIVAIIKKYTKAIGLDEKCFAAHSTRSGFCSSSSDRGVGIAAIMKRTRHKAINSVQAYLKNDDLFQGEGDRML